MKNPVRALLELAGLLAPKVVETTLLGLPKDKDGFYLTPSVKASTEPVIYTTTVNLPWFNTVTGIAYPGIASCTSCLSAIYKTNV